MNKPRISVAMCTYNGAKHIEHQLISILNQTYLPYELIICDDNSQDNTVSLITDVIATADFPAKITVHKRNVGINENFATAISMCTGEYIALVDQDDIWDSKKLQIFADEIIKHDGSKPLFLFSDLQLINGKNEPLGRNFSEAVPIERDGGEPWLKLAFGNFIPGCSTVFDRSLVKHILPIPSEVVLHDWWIALIFSLSGELKYIDKTLISYRIHEENNQGMNSLKRTLKLGSKFGFINIASNNFLIALRQLKAASNRLGQSGLVEPKGLAELCKVDRTPRLARPYILFKFGVRRARTLLASTLIRTGQACNDSIGHL